MNRNSILQARADHLDRMKAILDTAEDEGRDLNESERQEYEDRQGEVTSLEERLARLDQLTEANARSRDLDRGPPRRPESPDLGMSQKDVRRFSFLRVLHALANPGDRRAQEAASFERECSEAVSKRLGKTPQGIYVPSDVLNRTGAPEARDLNKTTATAGGHLVATDLLGQSFIELLRNRLALNRLGARTLTDLVGNIAIPRQTAGATAYWVAESGAPTESQAAFDQVTMSPKTVGAFTDYSRKLLLQASVDVEQFVRMDLASVIALAVDLAGLYGTGAGNNQPAGLTTVSGINTFNFAAAAPTWAEVVRMESEVAADNADVGTLAYLTDATQRGSMKTTAKASNTAEFIWQPDNTVNGYRAEVSNQVTDGDVIFGNWADLLIGLWGGLDLMVDPYTGGTSGTVRVIALQDVDVAVRHPVSFCFCNDGA